MKNGHGRPSLSNLFRQFSACMPRFCCFCHQKTGTDQDLCTFCQSHFPKIAENDTKNGSALCLRCGFEWPSSLLRQECAHCAKYQTVIESIISPFRYGFPIDHLIGRLKYQQHLPSGQLLGTLLAQQVAVDARADLWPDCLLPVPLSLERYRDRGFNHAEEIARACGAQLGIPVLGNAVGRHFDTASLAGLSRTERSLHIRGAFWVCERLAGLRVAIVDDVLTTGATSGELATELIDSGVNEIQLWVVARTPVTGTGIDS